MCAYWQLNITCSSIFCRFRCCSTSTSFPAVFSIKVSEPGITHEGMRLSNSDFLFKEVPFPKLMLAHWHEIYVQNKQTTVKNIKEQYLNLFHFYWYVPFIIFNKTDNCRKNGNHTSILSFHWYAIYQSQRYYSRKSFKGDVYVQNKQTTVILFTSISYAIYKSFPNFNHVHQTSIYLKTSSPMPTIEYSKWK